MGWYVVLIVVTTVTAGVVPVTISKSNVFRIQDEAGNFNFGYTIQSGQGASNFRQETRDPNGRVFGSYGIIDVDGRQRVVEYIADALGFRAKIKSNEPGTPSQAIPPSVTVTKASFPITPINIKVIPVTAEASTADQGIRSYTVPIVNSVEPPRRKQPQRSKYTGPIYASYYPIDTPKLYESGKQTPTEKTDPPVKFIPPPVKDNINTSGNVFRLTLLKVV